MATQARALRVAAWLFDDPAALLRACAGIEGLDLQIVDNEADLLAAVAHSEVLVISGGFYSQALAAALRAPTSRVRWLQFASAGYDRALAYGVPEHMPLSNASAAFAGVVAEHAVALLLALVRALPAAGRFQAQAAWGKQALLPQLDTLEGQTLALVGYGAIGQAVAQRAQAFGMRVEVVARRPPTPDGPVVASHPMAELHGVLRRADAVILTVALVPETRHLIDAEALSAMPRHARLVNIARGAVVDEQALVAALSSGGIAAAGLDVFEDEPLPPQNPLWRLPNVLVTPHTGGFGGQRVNLRLAQLLADNLQRYQRGEAVKHRVMLAPRAAPVPEN